MRPPSTAIVLACLAQPVAAQRMDYDALLQTVGEPVTTSVTGKPQRQSDTPASTVIITHDQIARSPARDVPGLLKTYAGIDVNRWTAGHSDVTVRGGVQTYNPRLLVLVDGRQVYLDHYGMTDWNLLGIQLEDIQQIELVRGPAGALFGFNAASGVVNIITRDVGAGATATATAELGSHDYSRLAATLSLPIGASAGLRVSGGRLREDERAIPADQFRPARTDDVTRDDVAAALDVDLDAQTRVTLSGGAAQNRQLELLVTQIGSEQRYDTQNAGVRAEHDTPWGALSGHVYANWLDARYGIGANDPGATPIAALQTFDLSARTVVAQASALVRLDARDTARLGAEYRDNRLDSGITFAREIHYAVLSANAMLDLAVGDAVALNVAARLDRLALGQRGARAPVSADAPDDFDRAFTTISFNAGVKVATGARQSLRLNGARGVQAPSLVVFGMNVPAQFVGVPLPVLVTGDPRIRPVTVWSGELAYDYAVSDALALEATGFVTRTQDAIAYPGDDPVLELRERPDPFLLTRVANVGRFDTYGVELSAGGRIGAHVDWRGNYTWTHTDQQLPGTTPAIKYPLLPGAATPQHKANVVIGYGDARWSGSVVARYTSATRQISTRPDTFLGLYDVAAAIAVDARLGYRLSPRLTLFAAGENLTGASGAALSAFPADTRVRGGVTMGF